MGKAASGKQQGGGNAGHAREQPAAGMD